jgi:hypothetical protein
MIFALQPFITFPEGLFSSTVEKSLARVRVVASRRITLHPVIHTLSQILNVSNVAVPMSFGPIFIQPTNSLAIWLGGKSLHEIQEITFEIGMLRQNGLDINDPQETHVMRGAARRMRGSRGSSLGWISWWI